jgi:hypothetical protein
MAMTTIQPHLLSSETRLFGSTVAESTVLIVTPSQAAPQPHVSLGRRVRRECQCRYTDQPVADVLGRRVSMTLDLERNGRREGPALIAFSRALLRSLSGVRSARFDAGFTDNDGCSSGTAEEVSV